MGDVVLKGGLRYQEDEDVVYIWHSSDNACEKCQALNEKTFCSIDEIPDLPHPNCKCWVEDKKKDDEECDCWKIAEKFDELIQQANSLRLELSEIVSRISGFAKSISISGILFVEPISSWFIIAKIPLDNVL